MKQLRRSKINWAPYIFISPFFVLFCVFGIYPILYSITTSFFDWKLIGTSAPKFVGLGNYINVLTIDPFFWKALLNTVVLLIFGSLLQHFIAIPLAILINSHAIKRKEFFKTTFFLPYITSTVSVVIIFGMLFDTNYGLVNWIISLFSDGENIRWMQEASGIKIVLSIILNWKFIGWNMVIYLAGLQAIPYELYEAAMIDGASTFRKHISITLPQLLPIIFFGVALSIIGGMQVFEEPFILTGGYDNLGGAENSGLTAAYYLMFTAFKAYRLGKGSAIAWLLFLVIIILNGINRKVTQKLQG
ncbi:MAG: sugar ABC transporter permease [Spirochaetes bacterium]|nr:sugar ABC transporter permease [Spirochaetota bacterium]MBU0954576.1 sugar ABC transporter permease [Spirochaetota bacterium]